MYIAVDRLNPTLAAYTHALRIKNIFLANWPMKDENGIQVCDRLYYYTGGAIQQSEQHLAIYKLLNTQVEDLEANKYDGIQDCWFYLRPLIEDYQMLADEVGAYINRELPLVFDTNQDDINDTSEWVISSMIYNPTTTDISINLTDEELIAKVLTGSSDIWYSEEDEHLITCIAMLDTDEIMFDREVTITYRSIEIKTTDQVTSAINLTDSTSRYIDSVNFDLRFRRKISVFDPTIDTFLIYIRDLVTSLDNPTTSINFVTFTSTKTISSDILATTTYTSIGKQLLMMYVSMVPVNEDSLNSAGGAIKTSGLEALRGSEFVTVFGKCIDSGYKKESVPWYKKALGYIIIVIAIVISYLFPPAAPAGNALFSAAAMLFFKTAGMALMISMVGNAMLSLYYTQVGDNNAAAYIGGTMQTLGIISAVLSVIYLLGAITNAIQKEALKQAVNKGLEKGAEEYTASVVFNGIKNYIVGGVSESTSAMIQSFLKFLSFMFNIYTKYIDPPNKGISELEDKIKEQEQELEDYTSPEMIDKVNFFTDTTFANQYDFNEYMQAMPANMTSGKNRALMNKHYDSGY